MSFRRPSSGVLRLLVLVILALVIVPTVFGQEDELIIIILGPTNDDFADAEPLVLNTTRTTVGSLFFAGTEALEASDSDLTACAMARTVWYTFVAPFTGNISFSTAGSFVSQANQFTVDTLIAVYSGTTLANLVQMGCNDQASGDLGELTSLAVTSGTTYYVRVGMYGALSDSVTGGYYRLTSVVTEANNYAPVLLFNGDFDVAIGSIFGGWTVKNAFNGDGIESGKFRFNGALFESTKIVQKASWLTGTMLGRINHLLEMFVTVDTISGTPSLKIALIVLYSDGTAPSKHVQNLTAAYDGTVDLGVWLTSPNVSKVKVVIGNKAASGAITVDAINLDYDGGLFRSEAAPLALPLP